MPDFTSLITYKFVAQPQAFTLFGATGDLAARKIFPALYILHQEKKLPNRFFIIGIGRKDFNDVTFREDINKKLDRFARKKGDRDCLQSFLQMIYYLPLDLESSFQPLKDLHDKLTSNYGTLGNRFFYLSVAPSFFGKIPKRLKEAGLLYGEKDPCFSNTLIEKPFGIDLPSAKQLDQEIKEVLFEEQIYRIDHYLGKETVQNLFALRFANHFMDHLFSSQFVESIQIIASEDLVVGDRVEFYEEVGCLRDILQNHLMQVLAFVAMEPPIKNESLYIHQEKAKVLKSIRKIDKIVRGQYKNGYIATEEVKGYREDERVKESNIDTFVGLRLYVENFRWASVPFYIFAGKALPYKRTEVNVVLKQSAFNLFPHFKGRNVISIKIQPEEKIEIKLTTKIPAKASLKSVKLDYSYQDYFGKDATPEAYETLIHNALCQDRSLFTDIEEVMASWELYDPIIKEWKDKPLIDKEFYPAGTWPDIMNEVFVKDQHLVM